MDLSGTLRIQIKNWAEFQHYRDRHPTWIKLHKRLLDDYEFQRLPDASRALAPMIWLLASEYDGGVITATLDELSFRLHRTNEEATQAIIPLINKGFLILEQDASNVLAECKQEAIPEKRREYKPEKENTFEREAEEIYSVYPRKVGKTDALKAIRKAITRELKAHPRAAEYLKSRTLQFAKSDAGNRGEFTPHPATWFNQERYNDDDREWQRSDDRRQPVPDVRAHTTVSCDECSDQFPVEHIGRHMTKNPVRQFCSEKCLNEYQGRLVSA
jgi:hypothetical protein